MESKFTKESQIMNGIMRCSRYSFGPNRLHYCGPDANAELQSLIESGESDIGLSYFLKQFKTLFPYLKYIAGINNIKDPFDSKVVEAYWLGNKLLEKNKLEKIHKFLVDDLEIKKKSNSKEFQEIEQKILQGAVPHHSFHVLNVWKKTGHSDKLDEVTRMNECLVNSGKVISAHGPEITIITEPLIYFEDRLKLGNPVEKKIVRKLEAEYDIEQIKPGQIVSIHWSVPCEIISESQASVLKKYTLQNIAFANQTM